MFHTDGYSFLIMIQSAYINLKISFKDTASFIKLLFYFHMYTFHSPILSGSDSLVSYPVKLDSFREA